MFDSTTKSSPQTIWGLIKSKLPTELHYEAKLFLGMDLVDQSEELISELESFSFLTTVGIKNLGQSAIHPSGFIAFTPHALNEIDGLVKYLTFKPCEIESFQTEDTSNDKLGTGRQKTRKLNRPSPYSPAELRILLQKELAAMEQRLRNVQMLAFSDGPPKLKIQPWSKADVFEEDSASEADFSKDNWTEDESSEGFESSRFSHSCERCTPRKTAKDSAREFLAEIESMDDLNPISEEEGEEDGFSIAPVLGDLQPPLPLTARQSSMDSDDSGCHAGTGLTGSVLNKVNVPKKSAELSEKGPNITPRLAPLNPLKQSHLGRKVETRLGAKKGDVLLNQSNSGAGDVHEEVQNSKRQLPPVGNASSFNSAQRLRRLVTDTRLTDSRTLKASKPAPAKSVRKRE